MRRAAALVPLLLVSWAFAQTTIFSENFDGTWSDTTPPAGWQIKYTAGDTGIAAWHKEPGEANPWPANGTGYAAIVYNYQQTGIHTDSLISPQIDCSSYRSVALRCSTFFVPLQVQSWTAKLMLSSDNGSTWTTLCNYAESLGPELQTFDVSAYADFNSQVEVMWVWSGDLQPLEFWALDNVSLTGTLSYRDDISVGPIVRPLGNELPNVPFTPEAYFNNVGRNDENNYQVQCEIDTGSGINVYQSDRLVSILRDSSKLVQFNMLPAGLPAGVGDSAWFTVQTVDSNPNNDSLEKTFNVGDQILVAYDNDTVAGDSYWTSGNQGWGLMVVTDTAPAQILDARFNLHLPVAGDTYLYKVCILDADGTGGAPGTTLYESGPLVAQEGWNTDSLENLQFYTWRDTFYLFYVQDGDWPAAAELNHDNARTDSVQYWKMSSAGYRPDSLNGDWMIRCSLDLAPAPVPAGLNARTVYVSEPDDQLVLRPLGVGFAPQARVENFGSVVIPSVPCACTVYTQSGSVYWDTATVLNLLPHQGAYVSFTPWVPDTSFDSAQVVVRTLASGDVDPTDDAKSKAVFIYQSHTTGEEPLDRYAWVDCDAGGGPTYSWVDTTNATKLIWSYGDQQVWIPLGEEEFTFPYRKTTYDQFWVGNDGWMSMVAETTAHTGHNLKLPNASAPLLALFPYWDSMYAGHTAHSNVWWKIITVGSAQRLVVIWQDMEFIGGDTNNLVTYEAILESGTGFIWFQYKHTNGGLASHNHGHSATVGIQNSDGARGLQYLDGDLGAAGYYPGNELTDGRAILFYPVRYDVGVTSIVTPGSYVLPGSITPQARVKNFGSSIESFYVHLRVNRMSDGSVAWLDSLPINTLSVGEETLLTFNAWTVPTGAYVLKCSTAMTDDSLPSNDSKSITFNAQSWLQEASIPATWTNKRVLAGAAACADSFVYVLKGSNTNEFWRYRIQSDSWDTLPSMPFGPTGKKKTKDGCALAANSNYVYAVKGGNTREFYRYNIASRTWATLESVPIYPWGLRNGTSMACSPFGVYLLAGSNTNDFLKFVVPADTWQYGVSIEGGLGKTVKRGASLDYAGPARLYALKGSNNANEFWEYNIAGGSGANWVTVDSIPLGPRHKKIKAGSCSAFLNNHVYLLKGGNMNEFWSFDAATKTWGRKSDIPLGPSNYKVKQGAAMAASDQALFVLKGGNRTEFWSYYPGFDTLFSAGLRKTPSTQSGSSVPITAYEIRGGPNPFVNATLIRLALPRLTRATLKVYDVSGKLVATLLDGILPAGNREVTWDARDRTGHQAPGGIYLLKFDSPDYHATQKLILER